MSEETDELKRLAEKATPGPWGIALNGHEDTGWVEGPDGGGLGVGYDGEMKGDDVRFIAAANPAAVLALLERLGRLEDFARLFESISEDAIRHHEWKAAGSKGMQVPFHGEFAQAYPSTVDALRRLAKQAREALKP